MIIKKNFQRKYDLLAFNCLLLVEYEKINALKIFLYFKVINNFKGFNYSISVWKLFICLKTFNGWKNTLKIIWQVGCCLSIKNLGYLKSAQCIAGVTPMMPFLTELSHVTKRGSFMIIVNDLVNGLIVMSPPNTSQS